MIETIQVKTASILGIGTAKPKHQIKQEDAAQIVVDLGITNRWNRAIPQLYRASGVERRGSVLLHNSDAGTSERQSFFQVASESPLGPSTKERMDAFESLAPALAIASASRALESANCDPRDVTHLITVSCSGFSAPGIDFVLIEALGLSHSVLRTNVGFMGCHAAINAMRIANSIAVAEPDSTILLCAVELCSLHQQYSDDPQQLVANSLFADGSASLILGNNPQNHSQRAEIASDDYTGSASASNWTIVDSSSTWLSDTTDMMSWRIGDHGFQMSLSPKVPAIIEDRLQSWMKQWLLKHSIEIGSIDRWIIHPGGPKILDACGVALGLSAEDLEPSRRCLHENGNMSSPTVLFILEAEGEPKSGELAVMLGFGPGLAIEAALLRSN